MSKPEINLVLIGSSDSGKSTLGGQFVLKKIHPELFEKIKRQYDQIIQQEQALLRRYGALSWCRSNKMSISAIMHESPLQNQSQEIGYLTVNVSAKFVMELTNAKFRIIDTPGHADFMKNVFRGMFMGNVCIMVVSAKEGEFEVGLLKDSQSFTYRKQLIYAVGSGIKKLIVCVNSMDYVKYSEERFKKIKTEIGKLIKSVGLIILDTEFIPISAELGENLFERSKEMKWYGGKTLTEMLESIEMKPKSNEECVSEPLRIAVYKPKLRNNILVGYIVSGMIKVGMTVQIPQGNTGELINVAVKNIQISKVNKEKAYSNSMVGIQFDHLPPTKTGYIISDPSFSPSRPASSFTAQISIISPKGIRHGSNTIVQCGLAYADSKFEKLIGILQPVDLKIIKENPTCLEKGDLALVEIKPLVPLFVESYIECNKLGRVVLKDGRDIIAIGRIVKVNPIRKKIDFTLFASDRYRNFIVKSNSFADISIKCGI